MNYIIVFFPLDDKYSIWDRNFKLVKGWFETKELAEQWLQENLGAVKLNTEDKYSIVNSNT